MSTLTVQARQREAVPDAFTTPCCNWLGESATLRGNAAFTQAPGRACDAFHSSVTSAQTVSYVWRQFAGRCAQRLWHRQGAGESKHE